MQNPKRIRWAGALTLAPVLLAWACGGSGNEVSGPTTTRSAPADVAGSWVGTWRQDVEEEPEFGTSRPIGGPVRLSLLQYAGVVTGTAEFRGVLGLEHANLTGLVAADHIELKLTNGTPALEGRLDLQVEGGTLSGHYSDASIPSAALALRRE